MLFGSWAQGRATAFSDVDVIYAEADAEPVQDTLARMLDSGVDLLAS